MGKLANPMFQIHKIQQLIRVNGELFTFQKVVQNEYKENILSDDFVSIEGIFHEPYTQISIDNASGARIERVPSPSILVITKEGYMPDLYSITTHGGKKYKVIGLKDVSNLGIATEISLEEIV